MHLAIPFHLIVPATVGLGMAVAIIIAWLRSGRGFSSPWYAFGATCFLVYGASIAFVAGADLSLQWDLQSYDIDNDRIFGGNEVTTAQTLAMDSYTNDLGRNLAPVTLIPVALIFGTAVGILMSLIRSLLSKTLSRGGATSLKRNQDRLICAA